MDRRSGSIVAALLAVVVTFASWLPIPGLETAELATLDLRARSLAEDPPPDLPIRLILVDEESLRWGRVNQGLFEWPWPREVYAAAVEFCRKAGAAVLVFAMDLSGPHEFEGTDEKLAEALASKGWLPIVLPVILGSTGDVYDFPSEVEESKFEVEFAVPRPQREEAHARFTATTAIFPFLSFAREASALGTSTPGDLDAIVRKIKPFLRFDGQDVPFLGLVAEVQARKRTPALMVEEGVFRVGYPDTGARDSRRRSLPLDEDGDLILRYRQPPEDGSALYPATSMSEVVKWRQKLGDLEPDAFEGSYVFLGPAAETLATPVGELAAVEIAALELDNLLNESFLRPAGKTEATLLVLVPAFGAALAVIAIHRVQILGVVVAGCAAFPWIVGWVAYGKNLWTPIAAPFLGVLVAAAGAAALSRATARRSLQRKTRAVPHPEGDEPFDVFLSHNSQNKPVVRELCDALEARGLRVWLDERELVPGMPWQDALEEVIRTARSAAVLVGADGLGPWEIAEMRACLSELVDRGASVIPVLLPGAPDDVELPLFLRQLTWVDLRVQERLSEEGIDRLVWGVTGQKPDA